MRNLLWLAMISLLAALSTASDVHAWGGVHAGYTHVGAGGAYHVGVSGYRGGYGYGRYGYGYRAGYGVGYGAGYSAAAYPYYPYTYPYYYYGYPATGYYPGVYRAY